MKITRHQLRRRLTKIISNNARRMQCALYDDAIRDIAQDILFLAKCVKYIEGRGMYPGDEVQVDIDGRGEHGHTKRKTGNYAQSEEVNDGNKG